MRLLEGVRAALRRPPAVGAADGRQRWQRGATAGGVVALVVQAWMLTAGTWNLLRWDRTADFYDAQARALLGGAFAMDPRVLGIEAFHRAGNAYMYFGPVPALYRLPVVALTDRFDGRLGALSMLAALVVVLLVVKGLGWRLRHLVLGDAPVTGGEVWATAVLTFAVVGASSLLYASSRTWVYHEAILWGVAYTLASYSALLLYLQHGARRFLAWATVLATLAIMTRASVGGGAVAGLAVVVGCSLAARLAERIGHDRTLGRWAGRLDWAPAVTGQRRAAWLGLAAVAVPVVSYASVNYLKFRMLFGVPFERQQFSILDPQRRAMLAANGGSLFNLDFIPSNLLQYWRPDMLGFSSRWPLIDYPQKPMTLIGHPFYDLIDATAGIPTTMPLLVALALVGVIAVVRGQTEGLRALRVVLVACVAGTVTVLNIGYIANRYQSDFLPLLVVPALVGAPLVLAWARRHRPALRRAVAGAFVGAATFGLAANLALGYTFQRAYAPVTPPHQIAGYLRMQLRWDELVGDGKLSGVRQGPELPPRGDYGDVFIVGDCDAVYWSDGMVTNAVKLSNWNGVERADGRGAFRADIVLVEPAADSAQPVFTTARDDGTGGATVFVIIDPDTDRMQFGYVGVGENWLGAPVALPYGTPLELDAVIDPRVGLLEVYVDGRLVLASGYTGGTVVTVGENTYDDGLLQDRFAGTITPRPIDMSLCRELLSSVRP